VLVCVCTVVSHLASHLAGGYTFAFTSCCLSWKRPGGMMVVHVGMGYVESIFSYIGQLREDTQ
jgi:hypothetical protein